MKERLLSLLVCTSCKGNLALSKQRTDCDEVLEGELACQRCPAHFPISNGIPRFINTKTYADTFGYQWHRFATVQLDSVNGTRESEKAFRQVTGLTPKDVNGRLVLDAGVGSGRYAEITAAWGGEVVGIDLTRAVDAAFENIGRSPGVHLIQADIFSLPFRPDSFDITYSIGVLHHTPSTSAAFQHVAATVKSGGQLAVYVYHAGGMARHFSDAIRLITTRLPRSILYAASSVAVPLYYVYRIPLLGRILETVFPISLHPLWRWRWLDTFDWYSPRYQWKHTYPEVLGWFRIAGFTNLYVADTPICVRGMRV